MELAAILTRLGLDPGDSLAHQVLHDAAPEQGAAPLPWRYLAAALTALLLSAPGERVSAGPTRVVGIGGGQGAGKTTLAQCLVQALGAAGRRAAACSLDDFYLTRAGRGELAAAVHPLFATRGVPATHDLELLNGVLDALADGRDVALPVFDKAADERLPVGQWRQVAAPLDVLVLEGWCLGATPEDDADLACPVNTLEAGDDPDGVWRRHVNAALAGPYASLWRRLARLVYLAVPDMSAVRRWRAEQERSLPAAARMSDTDLIRFVAHYERVTRHMAQTLPQRADVVVRIDAGHRIAALEHRISP